MFAVTVLVALLAGANGFRMAPAGSRMIRSHVRMSTEPWFPNAATDNTVSMDKLNAAFGQGMAKVAAGAKKKSVGDLSEADLRGKRVLVRVDFNVPLDKQFKITDDTRIRGAMPTIKYLSDKGAKVMLSSHLGRPKGKTPEFSLEPVIPRLSELLGKKVTFVTDCIGAPVEAAVAAMKDGDVCLLENVRFYPEEEKNDKGFAEKLAGDPSLELLPTHAPTTHALRFLLLPTHPHGCASGILSFSFSLSPCLSPLTQRRISRPNAYSTQLTLSPAYLSLSLQHSQR